VHPDLIRFHGITLHSYGLVLAISFLLGIQIFVWRGARRGLPEDRLHGLSLLILVLAIVGGRALFVLTHWAEYARDWLGIFRVWEGGLILYGGYILAIVGGILYLRRVGLPVWRVADAAAPSAALGIGLGRVGCFLNGCCFGLPTHLPWGISFPPGSYSTYTFPGEPLHPSQLYLAGAGLGLFAALLWLDRRPRFEGWLFWTYVAIDSVARFVIDFTRYYDQTSFIGRLGGLSFNVNQILSGLLLLTSAVMLSTLSRRAGARVGTSGAMPRGAGDAEPPSPSPNPAAGSAAADPLNPLTPSL
jgi:phosphatidylglycerol:prolipoprotein diacylglycerol transferase